MALLSQKLCYVMALLCDRLLYYYIKALHRENTHNSQVCPPRQKHDGKSQSCRVVPSTRVGMVPHYGF